jgi:hypothetical protein
MEAITAEVRDSRSLDLRPALRIDAAAPGSRIFDGCS